MARGEKKSLILNVEAKKELKAVRKDTKRGAFIEQLFSEKGVTSENSVLGKLWKGVHDDLGYGIRTEVVGATKNDKGEETGGTVTWFGKLPEGVSAPVWAEKAPKKEKAPKADKPAAPAAKPAPKPAPVAKPAA